MNVRNSNPCSRHIIVNADDFGMSSEVNAAVIKAFQRSLISSATIMANMPAFDDACALVRRYDLTGTIGLHLNFTSGRPLSAHIARCSRFCDSSGYWRAQRQHFVLSQEEQTALETEIIAQFSACERRGITPSHWDSHHHVHTEPGIAPVVIRAARRLGVKAIRPALNCSPGRVGASVAHDFLAQTYRDVFNRWLQFQGLARVAYFADARHARSLIGSVSSNIELMVHPMPNSRGEVVDSDGCSLEARIASLGIPHSELSSYQDVLRESPCERVV
jgi:predicted glycoside hydrolase/deacetylase ChbG (UPF0249 family)